MAQIFPPKLSRRAAFAPWSPAIAPNVWSSMARWHARSTALFAVCLGCSFIAAGALAKNSGSTGELEMLLRQVEQQTAIGHVITPPGDNAVDTWMRVLDAVSSASTSSETALTDFVGYMQRHAAAERAAGRLTVAASLSVFVDEATQVLHPGASPALPAEAGSPGQSVPLARSAQATDPASQDDRRFDVPNGLVQSATLTPHLNEISTLPDRLPVGAASSINPSRRPDSENREAVIPAPVASRTVMLPTFPTPEPPVLKPEPPAAAIFVSRGDAMLAIKDISAARKFYEHAALSGSARAATALAETYDPDFMNRVGTAGLRPDPAMAAKWYQKAAVLGSRTAVVRLRTLGVEATR